MADMDYGSILDEYVNGVDTQDALGSIWNDVGNDSNGLNYLGMGAKSLPQIGNMFGGGSQQQPKGKTFIPMQNAQMQTAKAVNPILDKGIARNNNLYTRLMG